MQMEGLWVGERLWVMYVCLYQQQQYPSTTIHNVYAQIRAHWVDGRLQYFGSHPDKPYKDAYIVSAQPELLNDFTTGLQTTAFELQVCWGGVWCAHHVRAPVFHRCCPIFPTGCEAI